MAIHSCTLAWKIPWTEEPDSLKITHGKLFRFFFFFLSLKTRITCYLFILYVRHVESYFPNQGLSLCSRHWKNRILTTALP